MTTFRLIPFFFLAEDFIHYLLFHGVIQWPQLSATEMQSTRGGSIIIDFGEPALEPYHPRNIYSLLTSAGSCRDAAQLTEGRLIGSLMGGCVELDIFYCANKSAHACWAMSHAWALFGLFTKRAKAKISQMNCRCILRETSSRSLTCRVRTCRGEYVAAHVAVTTLL